MGLMRAAMMMAAFAGLGQASLAAAQPQQRHRVTEEERARALAALDRFTSPTLTLFESEAEFRLYARASREVRRTARTYYYSAAAPGPIQLAQAEGGAGLPLQPVVQTDPEPLCQPGAPPPCPQTGDPAEDEDMTVTVTGTLIRPPTNPSITNNQMRGVEEGDIVKQIDHFLLVLQDGRIFVIDLEAGGDARRGLRLTDRANVYRDAGAEMWYDEMLVFGDRVLITGYSYDDGVSELAIFRLSPAGRLSREGVFRIASNDYYDTSNYATRLIGDDLIVYTPIEVALIADADFKWPVIRRWLAEDDASQAARREQNRRDRRARREEGPDAPGPALLDGAQIYRPVERIGPDAVVHTVSVCPLSATAGGQPLACRSTAFVAPEEREWYVTAGDAYLWTAARGGWDPRCRQGEGRPVIIADANRALLYRVPLSGAAPRLAAVRGMPPDQFAMQADADHLHALVRLRADGCHGGYDDPARLAFASIPLAGLGATLSDLPLSAFTPLPGLETHQVASRFTERYLVYGGLSRYRAGLPDPPEAGNSNEHHRADVLANIRPQAAWVVPVHQPAMALPVALDHTVIRAERVADDIVLTGYRDRRGLSVSLIDLDGPPRLASTARLAGRFESEGRSHAFNSMVEPDGSGLMGLPTVYRRADADRTSWRSRVSDLSFLSFTRRGLVRPAGTLERRFAYVDTYGDEGDLEDEDGVPGYQCEVSCIDWYGNSRPIFTGGRIFGLSGAELIEGRMTGGRISEVQRLNIALSPVPGR